MPLFRKRAAHVRGKGFTLISTLVSLAIFSMMVGVVYGTSASMLRNLRVYRENTTVSALAAEYMEIARNLPYSQVGTLSGNPHGLLPDLPNAKSVTYNNAVYKIYYEVTYTDDPADGTSLALTDFAGNDYKQVKLTVKNNQTGTAKNFITAVSPKGLESLSAGGALSLKVFDAVGQPVAGASIRITTVGITPAIDLTRTSDAAGNWIEVGLPNKANGYHIVVTKDGYSTDQTYAISGSNPNPTKPDATVANGQVTQVSFGIDELAGLSFNTFDQQCQAIPSTGVQVRGAKLIGTPSVYKFDVPYTSNSSGLIPITGLEWDTYTPALTGATYMIYGSSPIQQVSVLPDTSQTFTLILGPKTTNSLLVIVKDAATGNPIEGASTTLSVTTSPQSVVGTKFTAGSIWGQSSWTGGSGQANYTDVTKYFDGSGVSTTDLPIAVRLLNSGSNAIVYSGTLTSSTYDTGTASTTYTTISWLPASQDPAASVKFQVAANNENATWNFTGPDGTAGTYYTVPGSALAANLDNKRYVRYKAYLATTNLSKNPTLTSVSVNYVSGCNSPGQVMFPSLSAGTTRYQVVVSMPGYVTKTVSNIAASGYAAITVLLVAN